MIPITSVGRDQPGTVKKISNSFKPKSMNIDPLIRPIGAGDEHMSDDGIGLAPMAFLSFRNEFYCQDESAEGVHRLLHAEA